jgi:glucose/mannose transport system permease protein
MTDTPTMDVSAATIAPRIRRARQRRPHRIAIVVFLLMASVFFCVPIYVILANSFKTMAEIRVSQIFEWPRTFTLEAWRYAWLQACSGTRCDGLSQGFMNSVAILVPSLILSISIGCLTGYAIALWKVRWANPFMFVLFVCAFVPFQIIMYPLIKTTAFLDVYGTTFGVALVHAILALPILTLIFANAFRGIPQELISAAIIDSGSFWRIFFEIVLPMSGNIIIVVLVLQITGIWNDFLIGITFGGNDSQPMTVILNNMTQTTTTGTMYNVDMAGALLTAATPLLLYFMLGKLFVQGITAGAVKG